LEFTGLKPNVNLFSRAKIRDFSTDNRSTSLSQALVEMPVRFNTWFFSHRLTKICTYRFSSVQKESGGNYKMVSVLTYFEGPSRARTLAELVGIPLELQENQVEACGTMHVRNGGR
jgi:hypothetical protein